MTAGGRCGLWLSKCHILEKRAVNSGQPSNFAQNHTLLCMISNHLYWRSQFFGRLPLEKLCMADGRMQSQVGSAEEKRRGDVERGASMTPRTPLERHPHSISHGRRTGLKLYPIRVRSLSITYTKHVLIMS